MNPDEGKLVETDAQGRVVLPGHPRERFLLEELDDGRIVLDPAVAVTEGQEEYDNTPELQALLADAAHSATVKRVRMRRER